MNDENFRFYENLCEFLEDNISKLVRLKVSSRDKYKQFDKLIMDYIIADDVEDDVRMEVFGEQLEECFLWFRYKARKTIIENPLLLGNKLVLDYLRALGEPIKD